MRWVAPSEKDTANETLEKRLWAAADQFRANSGLKARASGLNVLQSAMPSEAAKRGLMSSRSKRAYKVWSVSTF